MKSPTILVGICSHAQGHERRKSIRETWLRHPYDNERIKCVFFIGGDRIPDDSRDDIVALGSDDSYEHLPAKCADFYRWALEHNDFDWIFKCDDDTYLAVDRLLSIPDERYDLIGDPSTTSPARMAPSGGAGYLLSRKLAGMMLEQPITPTGCEDLIFGRLALDLGARCKADERLCLHIGKSPRPGNDMVSCHWCSAEEMYLLDRIYRTEPEAVLAARHDCWQSDLMLYGDGLLVKSADNDFARLENHGGGLFSVGWHKWEKELVRQVSPQVFQGDHLTVTFPEGTLLPEKAATPGVPAYKPKVAVILSCYKKLEHMERQVLSMLNQDYPDRHVFVAVKGISAFLYRTAVAPLFARHVAEGKLTIALYPNKNQLSNMIDPVRGHDLTPYDLFVKVDDDDFYAPTYVSDCAAFYQTIPLGWSSYYNDANLQLHSCGGHPHARQDSCDTMFGFSFAFSRDAMQEIMACEASPERIIPYSARWDKAPGHLNYGAGEDRVCHMIIKQMGSCNRASWVRENSIPYHIMVNKTGWSMTRGDGLIQDDFRCANTAIGNDPALWEHILDVVHPFWEAPLRIFNNKGRRLDNEDTFTVHNFEDGTLQLHWDHYGEETFDMQEDGRYLLRQPSPERS